MKRVLSVAGLVTFGLLVGGAGVVFGLIHLFKRKWVVTR